MDLRDFATLYIEEMEKDAKKGKVDTFLAKAKKVGKKVIKKTKEGAVAAAKATKKGAITAAKATKKGAITAAKATKGFAVKHPVGAIAASAGAGGLASGYLGRKLKERMQKSAAKKGGKPGFFGKALKSAKGAAGKVLKAGGKFAKKYPVGAGVGAGGMAAGAGHLIGNRLGRSQEKTAGLATPFTGALKGLWQGVKTTGKRGGGVGKAWSEMTAAQKAAAIGMGGTAAAGGAGLAAGRLSKD